jgi:hypothetical protein
MSKEYAHAKGSWVDKITFLSKDVAFALVRDGYTVVEREVSEWEQCYE